VLGYIGKEIYRVYWGDIEEEIEELQEEVQDRMQDIRGRIDTVLHVNEIKGRWQKAISRARGEWSARRRGLIGRGCDGGYIGHMAE
jgi:hypothetical protein